MRNILCKSIVALVLLSVDLLDVASAQPASVPPTMPSSAPSSPGIIPLRDFARDDSFDIVKLSPDAKYVARTVDVGVKSLLAIQQRVDGKMTGHLNLDSKAQVQDFWWINQNRLLISVGDKPGIRERRQANGDLYAINADGSGLTVLAGAGAGEDAAGSYVTTGNENGAVAAFLVADQLPHEPNDVIVATTPLQGDVQFTRAEEMNINTARRTVVATAPVRHANFTVDMQGKVRFAEGLGADNLTRTYYREADPTRSDSANGGATNGDASDWQLLNDESLSNRKLMPLGFSADGRTAYLEQEEAKGPNGIYAFDIATHKMQLQLRDPVADPARILYGPKREVIGAEYADGKPRSVFFDQSSAMAKLYRSLEASFPDQSLDVTSFTSDGKIALISTYGDRSPGDYFLFDLDNKKAVHMLSHRDWIDPDRMAKQQPVTLSARDGVVLHGFLTLPPGSNGKNLPLVVNPHDGPFGLSDRWGFDWEVQLLASRGYAVLEMNYRGSGGFGRDFRYMGYKQWGGTMQDDLTDATRWAAAQGVADPHRICIYGAGYGAYAALMGAAREPGLYRCAVGYAGVYDLQAAYRAGDGKDTHAGTNLMKDTLGEQNLEAISPTHLADRINVPVLLVAGRDDERAPLTQTEAMRDALQKAGKFVDVKIYAGEGHSLLVEADREDFYGRMLDFLDRNIGAGVGAGR